MNMFGSRQSVRVVPRAPRIDGARRPKLIQRDLPAVSWLPSPPLAPLGWFRWCCHLAADHHAVPLASALAALDPGIYSGAVAAVARYRHFLDRCLLGWHGARQVATQGARTGTESA